MSAISARPSATARILFPAPPMTAFVAQSATTRAAARLAFVESPVTHVAPFFSPSGGGVARGAPATPLSPAARPGLATPHTTEVSCSRLPSGNGSPMAPATARPRHATPIRHCTAPSLPSTNSRVPSTGSTNTVSASIGSFHSDASGVSARIRSARSASRVFPAAPPSCSCSSSSPTMRKPGHVARSASTMAICALVSASVSAERGSSASLRVDDSAPVPARRSCTARISSQPFSAASTHVDSSSPTETSSVDVEAAATMGIAAGRAGTRGRGAPVKRRSARGRFEATRVACVLARHARIRSTRCVGLRAASSG